MWGKKTLEAIADLRCHVGDPDKLVRDDIQCLDNKITNIADKQNKIVQELTDVVLSLRDEVKNLHTLITGSPDNASPSRRADPHAKKLLDLQAQMDAVVGQVISEP